MMSTICQRLDRFFAIDGTSCDDIALMEERLAALQPRMPWLYAMMLSGLTGLMLSFDLQRDPPALAIILLVLTVWRGAKWMTLRRRVIRDRLARRLLRSIAIGSIIGSLAVGLLIIQIALRLSTSQLQLLMLTASTCTIAMTVPMTLLPRAARVSYLIFSIPASIAGMVSGTDRAVSVSAFNLLLCNLILLYLLRI